MYRNEKMLLQREDRFFKYEKESPSFSSTLLDQIYRSIDDDTADDMKLLREAITNRKTHRNCKDQDDETARFRRACLIEKWMDKKVAEKLLAQRPRHYSHPPETPNYADALFFSSTSTSTSSDSSSGGFSSSDTESMSRSAPALPRLVRALAAEKKQSETTRARNVSCYKPRIVGEEQDAMIKSKSRALKIYNNLKKVKQPISPGGKLATFLNSLFASKTAPTPKAVPTSGTCSSASSFSRSCLSKSTPPPARGGGSKRSVRFYPVSVIVGEDSRPCGHKSIYQEQMPVSVPTAWKIEESSAEAKSCRRVEETAREFLRDYKQNQKKNELMIMRDQLIRSKNDIVVVPPINDEDDDMDDAASYSSSDLFELDHIGNDVRFQEELPVYETTRSVHRNRAIF